jgi:hypothetical protein
MAPKANETVTCRSVEELKRKFFPRAYNEERVLKTEQTDSVDGGFAHALKRELRKAIRK